MTRDGFPVTKLPVEHIGNREVSAGPGHVIAVIIPVSRGHIGNSARRGLRFFYILQPFGIQVPIAKQITFAQRANGMIGQPGHAFIPLRTIQRHSLVIGANAPPGILMNAVYNFV